MYNIPQAMSDTWETFYVYFTSISLKVGSQEMLSKVGQRNEDVQVPKMTGITPKQNKE